MRQISDSTIVDDLSDNVTNVRDKVLEQYAVNLFIRSLKIHPHCPALEPNLLHSTPSILTSFLPFFILPLFHAFIPFILLPFQTSLVTIHRQLPSFILTLKRKNNLEPGCKREKRLPRIRSVEATWTQSLAEKQLDINSQAT